MQYGKQTVPMSPENESQLKYLPEKDMQVIGFVTLDQVPRHTYMKVNCVASLAHSRVLVGIADERKVCGGWGARLRGGIEVELQLLPSILTGHFQN